MKLCAQGKLDEATDQYQQTERLRSDSSVMLSGIKKPDEQATAYSASSGAVPDPACSAHQGMRPRIQEHGYCIAL